MLAVSLILYLLGMQPTKACIALLLKDIDGVPNSIVNLCIIFWPVASVFTLFHVIKIKAAS